MLYRSILRVSAVLTACVLVFQSGLISERSTLVFNQTVRYMAASVGVGMSASVQPTEYNSISAELSKQQRLLAAREEQVAAREVELGLTDGSAGVSTQTTTYILAAILLIQLVLLVLNYALDYLRARERVFITGERAS